MPIHLFIVHFPVALVLVGAAVDLVGVATASPPTRRWGGILVMLGAVAALLAFWTGQGALSALASEGAFAHLPAVESHAQMGAVGVWAVAVAGGLRALWRSRLVGFYGWINLALALLAALVAIGITLTGTAIRHGG